MRHIASSRIWFTWGWQRVYPLHHPSPTNCNSHYLNHFCRRKSPTMKWCLQSWRHLCSDDPQVAHLIAFTTYWKSPCCAGWWCMWRGCLFPMIITTFIEISMTTYLFSLCLLVSSRNSSSYPHLATASKSNLPQCPSPESKKKKLPPWTATPLKLPWLVVRRSLDIWAQGIRYYLVRRNEQPPGRCGLISVCQWKQNIAEIFHNTLQCVLGWCMLKSKDMLPNHE